MSGFAGDGDVETGNATDGRYDADRHVRGFENRALLDMHFEIAEKIVEYESALADQQSVLAGFTDHIATLKSQIKQAEKTIAENERQVLMVKTTESVQKATMCITDNISANASTMTSARESLERIKKRQRDNADKMAASKVLQGELSGDLSAKMKAAGIGSQDSSATSVLARLKK